MEGEGEAVGRISEAYSAARGWWITARKTRLTHPTQPDDATGAAGCGGGRVGLAHEHAVGRGERSEHGAVLDGGWCRDRGPGRTGSKPRALVVGALVVRREIAAEHGGLELRRDIG